MSNPTPSPAPIDWSKVQAHLDAIKKKIFEYEGKAGHNPFMWWAANAQELETKLGVSTSKTKELADKILALKFEVPKAPELGVNLRKPTSKIVSPEQDAMLRQQGI